MKTWNVKYERIDDRQSRRPFFKRSMQVEANARLIASAPDLLAALRGLVNQDDWEGEDIAPDSPIGKARAALARAERGEG